MANSLISFREDEDTKLKAISICASIGIDLPTYLRICIARLISEEGIPFSMKSYDVKNRGLNALKSANNSAKNNNLQKMTLDEINNEIEEARKNY